MMFLCIKCLSGTLTYQILLERNMDFYVFVSLCLCFVLKYMIKLEIDKNLKLMGDFLRVYTAVQSTKRNLTV